MQTRAQQFGMDETVQRIPGVQRDAAAQNPGLQGPFQVFPPAPPGRGKPRNRLFVSRRGGEGAKFGSRMGETGAEARKGIPG